MPVPAGAELVPRVIAVHWVDPPGDRLDPVDDGGQVLAGREGVARVRLTTTKAPRISMRRALPTQCTHLPHSSRYGLVRRRRLGGGVHWSNFGTEAHVRAHPRSTLGTCWCGSSPVSGWSAPYPQTWPAYRHGMAEGRRVRRSRGRGHGLAEGDSIVIERLSDYEYRISPAP
jgi:hypothetical protein